MTNDKDGAALLPCPLVEWIIELARRDIMRTQTDFIGRMGQALGEFESICDDHPDGELDEATRDDAGEALAGLAGLALAQLAMVSNPSAPLSALKSHGQAFDAAGVREACAKVIDAESKSCKEMEGMELAPESLQWARASEELAMAALKIRALPIPEVPASVEPVADDVRRLVIAAWEAWEVMGDCSADASYSANLDKALEAFSSRVTYENEPGNGGGFDPVDRYPTHEEWDTAPPSPGFGGGDLREAIAVVGPNWGLLWDSQDAMSVIVERTGLKIGDKLYRHRATHAGEVERLREALDRQCDNMAFVLNKATLPDQWYCKFSNELQEARQALEASR